MLTRATFSAVQSHAQIDVRRVLSQIRIWPEPGIAARHRSCDSVPPAMVQSAMPAMMRSEAIAMDFAIPMSRSG